MTGPTISVSIRFNEDSEGQIWNYLIRDFFKEYFIPQYANIQLTQDHDNYNVGYPLDVIDNYTLYDKEQKIDSDFTTLDVQNIQKKVLQTLSNEEPEYYHLSFYGSMKTYYQLKSDMKSEYIFRESIRPNYHTPIIHIRSTNRQRKDSDYQPHITSTFANTRIFLNERGSHDNKRAAEENWHLLIRKIEQVTEALPEIYSHSYCTIENIDFDEYYERIEDRFSSVPRFEGIDWA